MRLINGCRQGERLRKFGKKAGNKGWHLLMEDLGCKAEEFETCPAGDNRITGANKCVGFFFFSGFSTSRADSTLEFSQLFCLFSSPIFCSSFQLRWDLLPLVPHCQRRVICKTGGKTQVIRGSLLKALISMMSQFVN